MKNNKLNNLFVFVCSSGTGKSYLANVNDKYADMDFLKLKCKYKTDENLTPENIEK